MTAFYATAPVGAKTGDLLFLNSILMDVMN